MAELNLTKKQVEAYLKDQEDGNIDGPQAYAGTAQTHDQCPLALAYVFHHTYAAVSFNSEFADVDGHRYEYRHWQKYCIDEVDKLDEGEYTTVGYVRSLLAWR